MMFAAVRQRLKGWKTVVANAAVGLPAAFYGLYLEFSTVDFTPVIPQKYVALFLVANAVLGVILRWLTTGPMGSKSDVVPAPQTVKAGD
jgi:hypothetical protein